jgi:alanine dehydrogenase
MLIGIPKEIKDNERRVGGTPGTVREMTRAGHKVMVQTGAGAGIDYADADYANAGAEIVADAPEIFSRAEMIVKVKEPQPVEYAMLRRDQILFTYLHLAADEAQAKGLMASGANCIAYETVTQPGGGLPLLAPMSEVAGRLATQVGATWLMKPMGGKGILLGGVPGVAPAKVTVIGGGTAGTHALRMAFGLGAEVTVIDRSIDRLRELDALYQSRIRTIFSTHDNIAEAVAESDLLIGTVLIPGAAAPKLVTREMVRSMGNGAVIVDVAIDQGGCCETSRPTSHSNPVYVEEGVVHYCVTNMPGAVPLTSTRALTNATLPFILALARKGIWQAIRDDLHLKEGLNVARGHVCHEAVAEALNLSYTPISKLAA